MTERIKSAVLIVLVIIGIYLSYLNYGIILNADTRNLPIENFESNLYEYIRPIEFSYSMGNGVYTKISEPKSAEIWMTIAPIISEAFASKSVYKSITKNQYLKSYNKGAIMLKMPEYLTVSLLSGMGGSFKKQDDSLIEELLYSNETLFYKVRGGNYYEFDKLIIFPNISKINEIAFNMSDKSFRMVRQLYPKIDTANYTLIPDQYNFVVNTYTAKPELKFISTHNTKISSIARQIFEDSLDFVKSSYDYNGSLVMMYGLGEKSLIFEKDGSIIYSNRFDVSDNSRISDFDSINLGILYLNRLGGEPDGSYLQQWQRVSDNEVYLHFGYKSDYLDVDGADFLGTTIKIKGSQVTEARRHIVYGDEIVLSDESMFSIEECITNNKTYIRNNYMNTGRRVTEEDVFEQLVWKDLEGLDMVYYYTGGMLKPSWRMVIDGMVYTIDVYKGKPVR